MYSSRSLRFLVQLAVPLSFLTVVLTGSILAQSPCVPARPDTGENGASDPRGGFRGGSSGVRVSGLPGRDERSPSSSGRQELGTRINRSSNGSAGAPPAPDFPAPSLQPGPAPWFNCPGSIGDIISGQTIDPMLRGFKMNLLKDGFQLESLNLGERRSCGAEITAPPALVVSSTYRDDTSQTPVSVTQLPSVEPRPAILDRNWATFSSEGYDYDISATGWEVYAAGNADGSPGSPAEDASEVLERAIAELAPAMDFECFYQRGSGTWETLPELSLGDPRPALPAGFSEGYFGLSFTKEPPARCNPVPYAGGTQLSAGFFHESGCGYLGISAWSLPQGQVQLPGKLNEWGVSWTNDLYQFSIWGDQGGTPFAPEVFLAIAQALDSSFSQECFFETVELKESDLASHGFRAARAPEGFVLSSSRLTAELLPESCPGGQDYRGSYGLFWQFTSNDRTQLIEASATLGLYDRVLPVAPPDFSQGFLSWSDSRGTMYWVSGYSLVEGPPPSQELLAAVASSMDPHFTLP